MVDDQVSKPKHDGIRQYEKLLLDICNVEHFSMLTEEEKNGYYAVAMLLAYQEGAKPNLKEFAYRLRVSPVLLDEAFNNLRANGVFTSVYQKVEPVKGGLEIDDNNVLSSMWLDSKKREVIDLCWVAGIGAGYAGIKF